jgi:hypothetical protein
MMSLACIENMGVAPSGTVRLLDIREEAVTGKPPSQSAVFGPVRTWPTWATHTLQQRHRSVYTRLLS